MKTAKDAKSAKYESIPIKTGKNAVVRVAIPRYLCDLGGWLLQFELEFVAVKTWR